MDRKPISRKELFDEFERLELTGNFDEEMQIECKRAVVESSARAHATSEARRRARREANWVDFKKLQAGDNED
ncbi:hypothetical protein [Burkholderia cenocepacia]|jgi:hypothetical protein|uniref:hypothetical protein n=1 Tax=Burkholderia cenocepacia TaxID=95486 RepID=UPI0013DFDF8F|nr:hypothetical protein [Burkholderia cenocepacia]DAG84136.1 MAG TPA: hypothetical protein [Caudoviricetes sp.]MCW3586104.1 hypothetical protein [Burkholderia cenocepacia]MCW3631253.1 hypothetical protein [Burkholderia cenocepacia]MCW5184460.1 hypothetical protein [Burkholderia cenocepacia]NGO94525.1 hypothetical protein [Burkholderia cenocepacia]